MKVQTVSERSTAQYTCTLVDQAGATVTSLTALTLSLIDVDSGAVINSRDAQDVNGKGNVTVADGVVTWVLQPDDNVILAPARDSELHRAIFHATWEAGELTWTQDVRVVNVPTIGT
jgi:hypothetical protein